MVAFPKWNSCAQIQGDTKAYTALFMLATPYSYGELTFNTDVKTFKEENVVIKSGYI